MNYSRLLLLLQADWSWLTSPPVISAVVGLVVGVPGYFLGKRGRNASVHKTEAEAGKVEVESIKVLSECTASLSAQLLTAHNEMSSWLGKLTAETKRADHWQAEATKLQKSLTICEGREPLGIETANLLRVEAASIVENIRHVHFQPTTDPISEHDAPYVRRFKEIHASAKRMGAVV